MLYNRCALSPVIPPVRRGTHASATRDLGGNVGRSFGGPCRVIPAVEQDRVGGRTARRNLVLLVPFRFSPDPSGPALSCLRSVCPVPLRWLQPVRGVGGSGRGRVSDRSYELVECGRDDEPWEGVNAEFVVAAPEVLHERVASNDHAGRAIRL